MGNRAVITAEKADCGVYVHWNGGPESVIGFCDACRNLGYRSPDSDPIYGLGRLAYAIGLFFCEGETGFGIGALKNLDCDNGDNGVYVIGADWRIIRRYGDGNRPIKTRTDLDIDANKIADEIRDEIVLRATGLVKEAGRG